MEDYLHKAKSLALALCGAGKPKDDDDFIICLLKVLSSKFDPIVAAINARDSLTSLEVVISKLRDFELRLSPLVKIPLQLFPSILIVLLLPLIAIGESNLVVDAITIINS